MMRLIDHKQNIIIAELKDDKVIFHHRFLEMEMKKRGILIPPFLQKEFSGKTKVFLDDKDFAKAFKSIYVPFYLETSSCSWES
ncbi:MAG: hypothetical protein ACM3JI_03960 [Anaerolineae bacterium]